MRNAPAPRCLVRLLQIGMTALPWQSLKESFMMMAHVFGMKAYYYDGVCIVRRSRHKVILAVVLYCTYPYSVRLYL
jgi:hypothetical protein